MEVQQMQYLIAAIETKSLNKAAESLYTTQPNVSKVIKNLEEILQDTLMYAKIYLLGVPAMLLFNFYSSVLKAVGRAKTALYCLLVAGFINAVLDMIIIMIWKKGIEGAALATVISQWILFYLIYFIYMTYYAKKET